MKIFKIIINHMLCLLLSNVLLFVFMALVFLIELFYFGVDINDLRGMKQPLLIISYISTFISGALVFVVLKRTIKYNFLIFHILLFLSFFLINFLPVGKSPIFFMRSSLFLSFSSLIGYFTATVVSKKKILLKKNI